MKLITNNTQRTGTRFSKAEALDILTQCALLRESIDKLSKEAIRALDRPTLRPVRGSTVFDANKPEGD